MCIYAALSGHSEATEIEYYVELNFEYFKTVTKVGICGQNKTDRIG